ncbi:MAG: hypothetical protein KC978_16830 [Candidatus Omnitrophica bacterium]|nr:hypothetical protein [Candidatus Omnitrophota bacterium]
MQTQRPIQISETLWTRAEEEAKNAKRSPDEQVEHWAKLGAIAEDNSDLPLEFIQQILISREEARNSEVEPYVFGEGSE